MCCFGSECVVSTGPGLELGLGLVWVEANRAAAAIWLIFGHILGGGFVWLGSVGGVADNDDNKVVSLFLCFIVG